MRTTMLLTTSLLFGQTACTPVPEEPDTYANVLPDERVKVNLPVAGGFREATDWSPSYVFTAQVTGDVNALIGTVLVAIDLVTDLEPTRTDEETTAVWGPFSDGPLDPKEARLWVHHDVDTDIVTWAVAERPKGGSDSDWVDVIAGQVEAGATEEASAGWFAIDFDLAASLDPTSTALGAFVCTYDVDGDQVVASAAFEDFQEDANADHVNALYHYEQTVGGNGLMDLVLEGDLTGGGDAETAVIRSRWTAEGAGRADTVAAGGDLEDLGFTALTSECWSTAFETVYYANNWEPIEAGDASLCAFSDEDFSDDEAL